MKRIFFGLGLVFLVLPATSQNVYTPLSQASANDSRYLSLTDRTGDLSLLRKMAPALKEIRAIRIGTSQPENTARLLQVLAELPVVPELEISGSGWTVLPAGLEKISGLQSVTISSGGNMYYEDAFQKLSLLPGLKHLRITESGLKQLPVSVSSLQQVESFDISGNPGLNRYEAIQQLKNLPALRKISIGLDESLRLPPNLLQLPALEELVVRIERDPAFETATTREPGAERNYQDEFRVPMDNNRSLGVLVESYGRPVSAAEETRLLMQLQGQVKNRKNREDVRASTGFKRKYKGVQSPLPELDIPQTVFTVDAATGGNIRYKSGTEIRIPANAFTDAAGNPVSGPVTVSYREFRDQMDFVVSGIPMTYASSEESGVFESAGMFEINASVGNDEVFMAPGKNLDINFAATDDAPTYNFYQYDAQNGGWVEKEKAAASRIKRRDQETAFSNAWRLYSAPAAVHREFPDTMHYAGRYVSDQYFYTKKIKNPKHDMYENGRRTRKNHYEKLRSLVYLKKVHTRSKDTTCFQLVSFSSKHPELNNFSRLYFYVPEQMSSSDFRRKFGRKRRFNDIRVTVEGDQAMIEMKSRNGNTTISATIADLDKNNFIADVNGKRLDEVNHRFEKQYKRRIRSFDRRVDRELISYNRYNASFYRDSVRRWMKLKNEMSDQEKQLGFREWVDYCKRMRVTSLAASDVSLGFVRQLTVNTFGIYNCDQVRNQGANIYVKARFRDIDDVGFVPVMTYVINKKKNSILYYDCNHGDKYTPERFAFNGSAPNVLISVDADGMLAFMDEDEFRNSNASASGEHRKYKVHVVDPADISLDELKQKLGVVPQ